MAIIYFFCKDRSTYFSADMENAWHVYLNEWNQLRWNSNTGTVSIQRARSFGQRIADFFFRLLPIECQL
jgi:hypothetical protein